MDRELRDFSNRLCPHIRRFLIADIRFQPLIDFSNNNNEYNGNSFPCRSYTQNTRHINTTWYCVNNCLKNINRYKNIFLENGYNEDHIEGIKHEAYQIMAYHYLVQNGERLKVRSKEYKLSFSSWVDLVDDYKNSRFCKIIFETPKYRSEDFYDAAEILQEIYVGIADLQNFIYPLIEKLNNPFLEVDINFDSIKYFSESVSEIEFSKEEFESFNTFVDLCVETKSTPQELREIMFGKDSFPFHNDKNNFYLYMLDIRNLRAFGPPNRISALQKIRLKKVKSVRI